jgi:predicted AAA+ superfamily ATPase
VKGSFTTERLLNLPKRSNLDLKSSSSTLRGKFEMYRVTPFASAAFLFLEPLFDLDRDLEYFLPSPPLFLSLDFSAYFPLDFLPWSGVAIRK